MLLRQTSNYFCIKCLRKYQGQSFEHAKIFECKMLGNFLKDCLEIL